MTKTCIKNNDQMDNVERIKDLIASKGITKAKVAERCGIHISTLSKFVNGHPVTQLKPDKIKKIITYLEKVNTNIV